MKTGFVDFEMSNLVADYGQLLCGCVCEYRPDAREGIGKIYTYTLPDYQNRRWDDRALAVALRGAVQDYDLIVTWNGIKFDIPFLNTRLRHYGLKEVKVSHHIDLLYTSRFKLRLSNNKLDTVARYLRCHDKKSFLDPAHWTRAMGGHTKSYKYIVKHCQLDVKVLGQVYDKVKHLLREIK